MCPGIRDYSMNRHVLKDYASAQDASLTTCLYHAVQSPTGAGSSGVLADSTNLLRVTLPLWQRLRFLLVLACVRKQVRKKKDFHLFSALLKIQMRKSGKIITNILSFPKNK